MEEKELNRKSTSREVSSRWYLRISVLMSLLLMIMLLPPSPPTVVLGPEQIISAEDLHEGSPSSGL